MPENVKIEELTENIKAYVRSTYQLNKLETIESISVIGSGFVSSMVISLITIFFILFISIGIAFCLSSILGNYYYGFLIVGGFYFLLGSIVLLGREKLIEHPLRDKFIKKVFSAN